MVQVSYPGVYVFEVPPTVRPIAQVATSVAVFIDFFSQGPMNEAVQIFGMADFDRVFGGLDSRSEASYAISQFFLNHGSQAYVIRVASSSDPAISAAAHIADKPGGTETMRVLAANEGAWGNNVRFSVEPVANSTTTFNLVVTRYADVTAKKLQVVASEKFLNLSVSAGPRFYPSVLKDESALVQADPIFTPGANPPAPVGTLGGHITAAPDTLNGQSFTIQTVTITTPVTLTLPAAPPALKFTDLLQVRAAVENLIRTQLPTVAVDLLGDRLWIRNTHRDSKFDWKDIIQVTGTTLALDTVDKTENVQEYVLGFNGVAQGAQLAGAPADVGGDGSKPDATAIKGDRAAKTGLYALEDVDLFNMVCVPRAAKLFSETSGPAQMLDVYSKVIEYCEERRAFVLIDPPDEVANSSTPVQAAQDFLDTYSDLRSKNSAFYFPRVEIPDPLDEFRLKAVGVSGTMAGIYARTDAERGVWKAPAGVEALLRGVAQLDVKLTDLQNGALNPLAINCLRTFPVYGSLSWGARTLDGADAMASQWKYIPIRRLALLIEESLFRGTKWVVFEPNDEPLWAKIRLNVGAFMLGLFRQGAFQGDTSSKAFFVKCDGETTTANDRNLGVVNIEVGFAPLKPAEFVVLKIQQIPDVS